MYETLEYSTQEGIAVVRLNRPQKLNAINPPMVRELRAVTEAVWIDAGLRAVVLTGNGRAFSAGADIAHFTELAGAPEFLRHLEEIQTAFNAIEDLDRPTIAALNGLTYGGGCELALACDFRIMAEDATIGLPEIKLGILPGAGGTQRLPRLVPPAIAKQVIYFGEPLSSAQALQHGLVNAVVPKDRVLETALEWGRRLAMLPPLALRSAKLLVQGAAGGDLKSGMEAERQAVAFLFSTEDRKAGVQAFITKAKEPPRFTGR